MKSLEPPSPKPRGRPPSFDRDEVLDRALDLFWKRGFEAASMNDLVEAMDIRSPSIYAAFGDKARLFLTAVERYQSLTAQFVRDALSRDTARAAVEALLEGAAERFTRGDRPAGCFVVLSLLTLDPVAHPELAERLRREQRAFEDIIRRRLELGHGAGELSTHSQCASLARYVVMIYQALAISARDGQSRSQLKASARLALDGWPTHVD